MDQTNPFIVPGQIEETQANVDAALVMLELFEEYEAEATGRERDRRAARYGVAAVLAGVREAVAHMADDHVQLEGDRTVVEGNFAQPEPKD